MSMHESSKRPRLSDAGPLTDGNPYTTSEESGHRQQFDGGEHVHAPSLVVHVRGLPDGVVEGEIRSAVEQFGPVACVLLMTKKRQALVEFEHMQSAMECVHYSNNNTIHIRNTSVFFNYSTSDRIIRSSFDRQDEPMETNNVLLCTIVNATYPITCEVMYSITNSIAPPVRCVIFRKNGVQSMIEFANSQDASRVKEQLNGADIYSGCCTLKIEFAKPKKLNVFRNDNDTSWDWINPEIAESGSRYHSGSGLLPDPGLHGSSQFGGPVYGAYPPPSSGNTGYGQNYDVGPSGRPHTSHGYYQSGYRSSRGSARGGFRSNSRSSPSSDDQAPVYHHRPPSACASFAARGSYHNTGVSRLPTQPGCVVLVYGLADKWNCDKLFSILCMYGNVVRIKFLKSKEGSAMVQFAQVEQVENAIQALSGATVFGSRVNVHHSRQPFIEEFGGRPAALPDMSPSYKDYYKPPYLALQRYSTLEMAAKNRLQPPSTILHFFNAPPVINDEDVVAMLAGCGAPAPVKIRLLQGKSEKSSSGLLEFDSTDAAVDALLCAQHQPFYIPGATSKPPYTLKLCFSSMHP